jgi:alginate O-acetyltransferase complex protein AlgI
MSCYLPQHAEAIWGTGAILAVILLVGYLTTRVGPIRLGRMAAWSLVVVSVAGVERLNAHEPGGFRMLAIIAALLYAMKAVVAVEAQASGGRRLSWWRWLGFAALWPGMRPGPFAHLGSGPLPGAGRLLVMGLTRLAAGSALVVLARLVWVGTGSRLLATAWLLLGLSLVVHFGIFNLLAGAWRLSGVDCRPLFLAPLRSTSLAEFWGQRWNLAFSQMTALALYQPLVRRVGRPAALAASFLGSGLLHELAISLPVGAGYGMPLGYFALHGVLRMIEGRLARAGHSVDRLPWVGRAWTLAWLVMPLPVLFHRPFLAGVLWPVIGISSDS